MRFNGVTVETSRLDKQDVLSLLQSSLESGEPFATEFNNTIVKPLARKIERRIRVTDIAVDGKRIGKQIEDALITSSKTSTDTATKAIDDTLDRISTSFQKNTKSVGADVNIGSLFGQTPAMSKLVNFRYQNLLWDTLGKIKKGLPPKIELSKDKNKNLTLKDLLNVNPKTSKMTSVMWNGLQQKLLFKAYKAVNDVKFTL